jgi:hypothetical protein
MNTKIIPNIFVMTLLSVSPVGCDSSEEPEQEEDEIREDEPEPEEIYFSTERKSLHEVYSGSNCGPCKEADDIIESVLDANPDTHTVIHYQVGSDPYMSAETVARYCYYLNDSVTCAYSIPFLYIDGTYGFHPIQVNSDEGYDQFDYDRFQGEPCHMRLEVSHTVTDQTVDIDVTITPGDDFDSEQLVLQTAILEKTTFNNVGINEQTEFHHVMKKMVPNHFGTPLEPFIAGEAIELSLSYTFNGEYNGETAHNDQVSHAIEHTVEEFDDLEVVVFVQDNATKMVHQSEVSR